jgi:hypothetical protein
MNIASRSRNGSGIASLTGANEWEHYHFQVPDFIRLLEAPVAPGSRAHSGPVRRSNRV